MANVRKMLAAAVVVVLVGVLSVPATADVASVEIDHTVSLYRNYADSVWDGCRDQPDVAFGYKHATTGKVSSIVARFDLVDYAGKTVTGDGTLNFYIKRNSDAHEADPNGCQVRNLNVDFVFSEVTWNSRSTGNAWTETGGAYYNRGGVWDTSGQIGTFASPKTIAEQPVTVYELRTVTVSQAIIQDWIDGNNHGIVFAPGNLNTNLNSRVMHIAGIGNASFDAPTLDFNYVPEPATLCLLAVGGIGMLVRRRRRS